MKIKLDSKALESALALLCNVNAKVNMPILSNVLIECNQGTCKLTTADETMIATYTLQATGFDTDGVIIVNSKQLLSAVKGMAKQDVVVEFNPNTLSCSLDHSFGSIGLTGCDLVQKSLFPIAKELANPRTNIMDYPTISKHIKQCLCAVAHDSVRAIMTGVYYEAIPEQGIITSATDGRKLVSITYKTDANASDSCILPPTLCKLLDKTKGKTMKITHEWLCVKTKNEKGEEVEKWTSGDHVRIQVDSHLEIHSRTIKGNYPSYRNVIPKYNPFKLMVRKDILSASIARVGNFCNSSSTLMGLTIKDNSLTVFGKDTELLYSAKEKLVIEDWNGNDFKIGVSWTYFKDMLSLLSKEIVQISLADSAHPLLILEENENVSLTALLMPMKLEEKEIEFAKDKPAETPAEEPEEDLNEEENDSDEDDDAENVEDTEEDAEDGEEDSTQPKDLPF